MISIKRSHSYCLFFKVAQNFGVGYQQKDLKNLLDQVTLLLFFIRKEFYSIHSFRKVLSMEIYHHAILTCTMLLLVLAASLDVRVGGIEHTPEASCTLPVFALSTLEGF